MALRQDVVDGKTRTSMNTKIVGDQDCKISTIVLAIDKEDGALVSVQEKWKLLAQDLGIRQSDINTLERNLKLGIVSITDVLTDLLHKWVSKEADQATLTKLIQAAKDLELGKVVSVLEIIEYGNLC